MAKKYISGMVDPEVKDFVEKEAAADDRSVSYKLNELLKLGVHTRKQKAARSRPVAHA